MIRPAVAALVAAGRTDAEIAAELSIHRTTANRNRRRLAAGNEAVLERLAAEYVPLRPSSLQRRPWTPEEQARHRQELLDALDAGPDPDYVSPAA